MNKLIPLLISGVLIVGVAACETNSKTSSEAPSNVNEEAEAPTKQTALENQQDATSETRKKQIESDIRAREERNNLTGGDTDRADADLESEIRGKLEANLPASQLTVDAKDGAVTLVGTVPTQQQLNKIPTLAQQIKGVKTVDAKNVKVAPATPAPNTQ